MSVERAEGFVLQAQPYQDHHHIATVFTRDQGVVRLFVRGTSRIRRNSHAIVTPLTRAEFHFSAPKSGGLYRLHDASLIDQYLPLREEYDRLECACFLAGRITGSQLLWKPAPALYQLLCSAMKQVALGAHLPTVRTAFLLKLLRHEGLLGPAAQCHRCQADLEQVALASGEVLCPTCAPSWAMKLEADEWLALCQQMPLRSWQEILHHPISESLGRKLEKLFEELVSG